MTTTMVVFLSLAFLIVSCTAVRYLTVRGYLGMIRFRIVKKGNLHEIQFHTGLWWKDFCYGCMDKYKWCVRNDSVRGNAHPTSYPVFMSHKEAIDFLGRMEEAMCRRWEHITKEVTSTHWLKTYLKKERQ